MARSVLFEFESLVSFGEERKKLLLNMLSLEICLIACIYKDF